jgi:hypothetical protein
MLFQSNFYFPIILQFVGSEMFHSNIQAPWIFYYGDEQNLLGFTYSYMMFPILNFYNPLVSGIIKTMQQGPDRFSLSKCYKYC